jgi:hypothetical protein
VLRWADGNASHHPADAIAHFPTVRAAVLDKLTWWHEQLTGVLDRVRANAGVLYPSLRSKAGEGERQFAQAVEALAATKPQAVAAPFLTEVHGLSAAHLMVGLQELLERLEARGRGGE